MKKLIVIIVTVFVVVLFLMFFILCFHYEATYTTKGTVYSVNGNEITFEDTTGNLFSCYTEENNPNVRKGEKFILKFDHKGTESDRSDDGLIDYGKHSFLCLVW